MKSFPQRVFSGLILAVALAVRAQTLDVLFTFGGTNGSGAYDLAAGGDGFVYGITYNGGDYNYGKVYRLSTNGDYFTLVSFNRTNGAYPGAALLPGNDHCFYGTTTSGGTNNHGTVFRVDTNGALTTLAIFDSTNSLYPRGCLAFGADGGLYGATQYGGISNHGTIFRVDTNNCVCIPVASFDQNTGYPPLGSLASGDDGFLYGAAENSGVSNNGTIFRMGTDGTLDVLLSFNRTNGGLPRSALVRGNDGGFYGTTDVGGSNDHGTVYRISTNGELTTLYSLSETSGTTAYGRLALGNDGWFYGAATKAGPYNGGTVFRIKPDGTWNTLFSFNNTNNYATNVAIPNFNVVFGSDGNLYGATSKGGIHGLGVIYRLNLPHIRLQPGAWFNSTDGFTLSVDGLTGHGPVILLSSTNLLDWSPVSTNPPATGTLPLQDIGATNRGFQFYRVLQE